MKQLPEGIPVAAALLVLAALFLVRGLLPPLQRIETDFPNYYTAGRLVAEGSDLSRLYDDAWFQEQIHRSGIPEQGKFSPFPPPTALLFAPLSLLPPIEALRVMTMLNLVLLLASVMLLSKILSLTPARAALLVLVSGAGLWNCFRFGQLYVALSASVILGYYLFIKGRPLLAGIAFGILIPVKYYPVIFLPYFLVKKEWRVVLGAAGSAAALGALSVAVMGWEVHREFLLHILGKHLASDFSGQTPYATAFQSWDSLLHRLFMYHPEENPSPLVNAPVLIPVLKLLIAGSILAATSVVLWKVRTAADSIFREASFAMLGILPLVLAPGTATYHFVLLWLPGGLLLRHLQATGARKLFYSAGALYSLLGFLPYGLLSRISETFGFAPIAYPRLILILALLAVSCAGALASLNPALSLNERAWEPPWVFRGRRA